MSNTRLDQYEGNLKRVLRDTAPKYVEGAEALTPDQTQAVVPQHLGDQRGRVVLVVGSVGCGKSTFVTRALIEAKIAKAVLPLKVDLINDTGAQGELTDTLLWRRTFEEWQKYEPEALHLESLRKVFGQEIKNLREGPRRDVFQLRPDDFVVAEAELLEQLSSEPSKLLTRYWRYLRKHKSKGIVIFLDNVDRASETFQKETYAFAHRVATDTGATVIVPMREMTYYRGKDAGFLDIRAGDTVYHLQAPDPIQILSKRVRYVEDRMAEDHRYRQWKNRDDGDQALAAYRKHAATLKRELLSEADGQSIVPLLSAVAWHDIRAFLAHLRQTHVALGDTDAWTLASSLAALLATQRDEGRPLIPGLYTPPYPAFPCFFIRARLLAALIYAIAPEKVRQGTPLSSLLEITRVYGYHDRWTQRAVTEMVQERLLECLEAPAAAEHTRDYLASQTHSYRPSPLAVVLLQSAQFERTYLALTGANMTFHARTHYQEYVECIQELAGAAGGYELGKPALALLTESTAADVVGRYLSKMFAKEKPLSKLTNYAPVISIIETRLGGLLHQLPGFTDSVSSSDPPKAAAAAEPGQLQLGIDVDAGATDGPRVPPPDMGQEADAIAGSELPRAVFWALVERRASGKNWTTGATIARLVNDHVFPDSKRKEPTNVSRALRGPLMRSQAWLDVAGEKRRWLYGLKANWQESWEGLFDSPAPDIE